MTNRHGYSSSRNKLPARGLITKSLQVKLFQKGEMVQLGPQTPSNDILEYKPAHDDQPQHRRIRHYGHKYAM